MEDLLADSAQLLRQIFVSVLPPAEEEDLQDLVREVVRSRTDRPDVLVRRYAGYCASDGEDIGPGPLVKAGLIDEGDWARLAVPLLQPRATIVSALRAFELD